MGWRRGNVQLSSHRLIFGPSWLQSRSPTWRKTTEIRTNRRRYEMLVFRAALYFMTSVPEQNAAAKV
jgi:hypothetical protein